MKQNTESILLQEHLIGPAFLVVDGVITQVNTAATQLGITPGTVVEHLIAVGAEAYQEYRSGKLYLQLNIAGIPTGAYVTKADTGHLFCLNSAYQSSELRVLALAAQQLRTPLSTALLNTDQLQNSIALTEDIQAKAQLSQLNRSLYQLLRAVGNMADASGACLQTQPQELRNATAVFDELMEKAAGSLALAKREFVFKGLKKPVECYLNTELLERAVLNLISNAAKFSHNDSVIQASLRLKNDHLVFTVENSDIIGTSPLVQNAFQHFLRDPGVSGNQYGIGLGMSIVLGAASAHGGTVLFSRSKKT
ncbi:MAG: HAMP domain-containing histidine kinase, partial [Oscillospiraceae bacterium]|nr:HAMP domain-containing histidine kinase [Oscillospiraceae bacterium]